MKNDEKSMKGYMIFLVFFPIISFVIGFYTLSQQISSYSWEATDAIVDSVYEREYKDPDDYSKHYQTHIKFSYKVKSVTYRGDEPCNDNKLKKGNRITIYFDPEKPRNVTLKKGLTLGPFIFLIYALSILLFLYFYRKSN